jgi:hypothetical protein
MSAQSHAGKRTAVSDLRRLLFCVSLVLSEPLKPVGGGNRPQLGLGYDADYVGIDSLGLQHSAVSA